MECGIGDARSAGFAHDGFPHPTTACPAPLVGWGTCVPRMVEGPLPRAAPRLRRLAAQPQAIDQRLVAVRSCSPQVLEKPAPLAHQPKQPATRVMVLPVDLEMLREPVDAIRQQRHLDFRRARVGLVASVGVVGGLGGGLRQVFLIGIGRLDRPVGSRVEHASRRNRREPRRANARPQSDRASGRPQTTRRLAAP